MTNGQILSILKALSSDDRRVMGAIRGAISEVEDADYSHLPAIDGSEYSMLATGNVVGAIKAYNGRTGAGLRESKLVIDRARAEHVWGRT